MKDGDYIIPGDKYEQYELPDGTCKLVIAKPETEEDSGTYTCEAECNGCSDSISHNVQYEGSVENQFNRIHRYYHRDPLKPFFKTGLTDYTIPSGGSIALFIETAPNCEAEWFRERWAVDHKPPKRYIFNDGNGFFACVINHATMDESGKYMCKVTNPYGTSQSSSYVDIINPNSVGKGQKPPTFLTRPQTEIKIRAGDPFSMSFRVQGEPKPRSMVIAIFIHLHQLTTSFSLFLLLTFSALFHHHSQFNGLKAPEKSQMPAERLKKSLMTTFASR
jgi:Immunoglobulin I-set domain